MGEYAAVLEGAVAMGMTGPIAPRGHSDSPAAAATAGQGTAAAACGANSEVIAPFACAGTAGAACALGGGNSPWTIVACGKNSGLIPLLTGNLIASIVCRKCQFERAQTDRVTSRAGRHTLVLTLSEKGVLL